MIAAIANQNLAPLYGGIVCFISCVLLVLTQKWHGHLTHDHSEGIQKVHLNPTPRIGGVGVVLGLLAAWSHLSGESALILKYMIIAGLPAFLFGIAEDLTRRVGVRERLLATMCSGFLMWWLTGVSLRHVNVYGLDSLMILTPISVLFTSFAVGGVANAINIIDGFNGLAAGTVLICFSAIGLIAYQVGDTTLMQLCYIFSAISLGFLCVNFPFGKIFLGDGGAYLLGFLLAWTAVLLPMRNPQVSAWAGLLVCGYPVLEVLFSVSRRLRRSLHPGHPDRVHLHSLVKSRFIKKKFSFLPRSMRNAAVSPCLWLYALVPASLAVVFANDTFSLLLSFIFCAFLYQVIYMRFIYFRWTNAIKIVLGNKK